MKLRDLITGMGSGNAHGPMVEGAATEWPEERVPMVPVATVPVEPTNGWADAPPAP